MSDISGVMTDLLVYSIVIPVLPFQLEHLGYTKVSSLVGWLLFAYVCFVTFYALLGSYHLMQSAGLVVCQSSLDHNYPGHHNLLHDFGSHPTNCVVLRALQHEDLPAHFRPNNPHWLTNHAHGVSDVLGHGFRPCCPRREFVDGLGGGSGVAVSPDGCCHHINLYHLITGAIQHLKRTSEVGIFSQC